MADATSETTDSRRARHPSVPSAGTKQELSAAWLESLTLPPSQLARCLSVHARAPPPGERSAVQPVVRVQLPGSNAAPLDFTDVLMNFMHLLVCDHSKFVQRVQSLLRAVVTLDSSQTPCAALVIPTLRIHEECTLRAPRALSRALSGACERLHTRRSCWLRHALRLALQARSHGQRHLARRTPLAPTPAVLRFIISACYYWVGSNISPLTALAILSAFAVPGTTADQPAARQTCMIIRGRPNFSLLVQASLRLARDAARDAARSDIVLGRFWDAVLGTPSQVSADRSDAWSDAARSTLGVPCQRLPLDSGRHARRSQRSWSSMPDHMQIASGCH